MPEQQVATPAEATSPEPDSQSFDDKLLAKFGIGETEQPEPQPAATPATQETTEGEEAEPIIEGDEPPPEPVGEFELKHNGELKKVPMSEAQRLAQMGYDYEFKMQRVNADAAQVKGMAQAIQARAAMQAQTFDAMVEVKAIENQLAAFANIDWVAEANGQDPIGAFQKRMQHDNLVQAWHQASAKVQQLQQPIQQASQHIDAAQVALEGQKLTERIPEWKDPSRREKESTAILQAMVKDFGFAQNEIGGPLLNDHRVVAVLRDAWKYRQAIANQKANKGQLQGLPKVATPGAKPLQKSQSQSLGDVKRGLAQVKTKEGRRALEDELIARKFGLK